VIPFLLLLAAVPFVLPIVSLVLLTAVRRRLTDMEELVQEQQRTIEALARRLRDVRPEVSSEVKQAVAPPVKPEVRRETRPDAPSVESVQLPAPVPASTVAPPPIAKSPSTAAPPIAPPSVGPPVPPPPVPPRREPPQPPPPPIAAPEPFDWERLIGVKMFSAVAGVALVLAAVFFLRYSIDQGWLVPPIRVAIGVLTGVALLVVCDLKAARRYPVTANAMDAAAIAILFSTFFAAHALWNLIPAAAAFALLALVTGVAVLLSIRRDSLFIAVLGLLGGFATPVLLSTGENRPVPLFAYLLMLNIGLAWVATRQR